MMSAELKLLPELHAAIRRGLYNDVRLLVNSGFNVDIQDPERRTALITCCFVEQEDWAVGIARMLLEREAKVGLTDRKGRNALMHACIYQRGQLISLFLKAIDYNVDHRDLYGNTALFYAASTGNTEILRALLEKMLKFKLGLDQLNKWGMSALMEACRLGHEECMNVLISKGASDDLRDRVCGKNAREWLQEHKRLQKLSEPSHRKLRRRTPQSYSSLPSEFSNNMFRSRTQFESIGVERVSKQDQKSKSIIRSVTGVSNRVRMEWVQRNWIQNAIGDDIINVKFQPCLYTNDCGLQEAPNSTIHSCRSPRELPQINHWRTDFGKMYKRFEVLVSSSYRNKAMSVQEVPCPLSRKGTMHSIQEESVKSSTSRRSQATLSAESSQTNMSVKNLSKKSEMYLNRKGSNPQMKSKQDDAASSAARILANAVRRRKLLKQ